ncbi:hypothetical protein Tco_1345106 [Tanacetum coccineum]
MYQFKNTSTDQGGSVMVAMIEACLRADNMFVDYKWVSKVSRMSNTSDKGTTFGDGAARVGIQLRVVNEHLGSICNSIKVDRYNAAVIPCKVSYVDDSINLNVDESTIPSDPTFGYKLAKHGDMDYDEFKCFFFFIFAFPCEPKATTSAPKKGVTNVGNTSQSASMLKTTGNSSKKDNLSMSNSFIALNNEEEDDEEEDVENVYDESANLIQNTKDGGSLSFTAAAG